MKAWAFLPLLVALTTVSASSSLPPIEGRGNAFWAGDKRFYIRGIDYQPGGSSAFKDPLADPKTCLRDIKQFEKLGLNAVRVYTVDNSKDHDECMRALQDAGIYLILDVNTPAYSLNRLDAQTSYNAKYLRSVFATVEMFAKYDNTMAFFSGNEVIDKTSDTVKAAPYVKAVTRDIKDFIRSRSLRAIPVGYSAADVSENRMQTAMYMNCGPDAVRSDFFAFNDYSWCNSNFAVSGWDQKVKNFTDYGLPIFLSEWGCNTNRPRKFEEMAALMSADMSSVYSGGLMFEYSTEENKFGIVKLDSDGETAQPSDEFELFKEALRKNPAPTGDGGATATAHAVQCPTSDSSWNVDPSQVPAMPHGAEEYMKNGAGGGPGLTGGSQDAVDSGTSSGNSTDHAGHAGKASRKGAEDNAGSTGRGNMAAVAVTALTFLLFLFSCSSPSS